MADLIAEALKKRPCCGDLDDAGVCAAPACEYAEAFDAYFAMRAEIDRLRALLRKAKDRLYDTGCWDEADEIVAALGEGK